MKVKTSVTLSEETLRELDRLAGEHSSRSAVVERAVREYALRQRRAARDARDREAIDAAADELNEEMADILGYQVEL